MTSSPGRTDGRAARWSGQRERRRREFVEDAPRAIAAHTTWLAEHGNLDRYLTTHSLSGAISDVTTTDPHKPLPCVDAGE